MSDCEDFSNWPSTRLRPHECRALMYLIGLFLKLMLRTISKSKAVQPHLTMREVGPSKPTVKRSPLVRYLAMAPRDVARSGPRE
jgi:hypothetical protein